MVDVAVCFVYMFMALLQRGALSYLSIDFRLISRLCIKETDFEVQVFKNYGIMEVIWNAYILRMTHAVGRVLV